MSLNKLVHINNKLYQALEVTTCPNCNRQILETDKGEVTILDEHAQVKSSCNHCGHEVVVTFSRLKPFWVYLVINGKKMKAESIQTCNDRWCKREFLLQSQKDHLEYDRAEEWHVPIQCPHCLSEHWINLYELDEN